MLVAASQAGIGVEELKKGLPRVAELPFESDRKRMTTVHKLPETITELPGELQAIGEIQGKYIAFTKGSIDGLVDLTSCVWNEDQAVEVDDAWRERIQQANDQMAQNGMRVLGVGFRWLDEIPDPAEMERDLTVLGMIGMIDPPRPEVPHAVRTAKDAGIRTIMITGDHPLTARFIAHELGITDNNRVKTGQNLNDLNEEEFSEVVENVNVFARVSPEHKLRIVEALQNQGNIVAMTGDGVNDSPALKKSNIGIAMGITGTDVTKEASQIVLLDDNFATIVSAVRDGRVIYDNIRRFVKFSIAGNLGKVIVMLFAPLFGINVALLPLQLLWLNLLTDGLLGIGLGLEQPESNTMQRPPRDPQSSILSDGVGASIIRIGLLIGVVALALGVLYYDPDDPGDKTWQTMMFTTLAFLQIGQAMASRSNTESYFSMGLNTNPALNLMIVITFVLQLIAIYVPFFDDFFGVEPLSLPNLLIATVVGGVAFVAIELEKYVLQRFRS
jgi:Ca2+-transporting ATPase